MATDDFVLMVLPAMNLRVPPRDVAMRDAVKPISPVLFLDIVAIGNPVKISLRRQRMVKRRIENSHMPSRGEQRLRGTIPAHIVRIVEWCQIVQILNLL